MKSLTLNQLIWRLIAKKKQVVEKEINLIYHQVKQLEKIEEKNRQAEKFYSNGYLRQLLVDSQYEGIKEKEFELA